MPNLEEPAHQEYGFFSGWPNPSSDINKARPTARSDASATFRNFVSNNDKTNEKKKNAQSKIETSFPNDYRWHHRSSRYNTYYRTDKFLQYKCTIRDDYRVHCIQARRIIILKITSGHSEKKNTTKLILGPPVRPTSDDCKRGDASVFIYSTRLTILRR